jgi:hypothetical protein
MVESDGSSDSEETDEAMQTMLPAEPFQDGKPPLRVALDLRTIVLQRATNKQDGTKWQSK